MVFYFTHHPNQSTVKKLTLVWLMLAALTGRAQLCDEVSLSLTTTSNLDFSFDTYTKYQSGLTINGATRLKVTVKNNINNNPDCRWNLVIYVENGSASTPPNEWEMLYSASTSGNKPEIDLLQLRIRNACNTSLTGNQFFNVPTVGGTPILIISNNGVTTPAGSCTTNVNGPGDPINNYNEFNFDIDYRLVPGSGFRSGTYQLRLRYVLIESL